MEALYLDTHMPDTVIRLRKVLNKHSISDFNGRHHDRLLEILGKELLDLGEWMYQIEAESLHEYFSHTFGPDTLITLFHQLIELTETNIKEMRGVIGKFHHYVMVYRKSINITLMAYAVRNMYLASKSRRSPYDESRVYIPLQRLALREQTLARTIRGHGFFNRLHNNEVWQRWQKYPNRPAILCIN